MNNNNTKVKKLRKRKTKNTQAVRQVVVRESDRGRSMGLLDVGAYPPAARADMFKIHYRNPFRIDPFPQRYRTVLTTAFRGEIGTGSSFHNCIARLNSPYLPFDSFDWPGANPPTTGLSATGFARLCSITNYRLFRVISSRITLRLSNVADVDNLLCTITPTSSGSNPNDTQTALTVEFTRFKQMMRGQPARDMQVVNKISQSLLLGVRQQAIEDDLSGNFTGSFNSTPGIELYWRICIQNLNSENFNTGIGYTVSLEHDVEFWGDSQAAPDDDVFPIRKNPKTPPAGTLCSSDLFDQYMVARAREQLLPGKYVPATSTVSPVVISDNKRPPSGGNM